MAKSYKGVKNCTFALALAILILNSLFGANCGLSERIEIPPFIPESLTMKK